MKRFISITLLIGFLLIGCETLTPKKPNFPDLGTEKTLVQAKKDIENSVSSAKKSTENIQEQVSSIQKNTAGIKEDTSPSNLPLVSPHLTEIESEASSILAHTKNINENIDKIQEAGILVGSASKEVDLLQQALVDAQKDNSSLIQERDKAIADKNSSINRMLTYLIVGSILGSIGFMAAFLLFGNKMGMFGAVICACVLVVSIFVQSYFKYIAIAGGVVFVGLIVLLFVSIFKYKKGVKELVDTVEVVKDNMTIDERDKIFGDKDNDGIIDIIQSPATEALVKSVKASFPSLWKYVKKYKQNGQDNIS